MPPTIGAANRRIQSTEASTVLTPGIWEAYNASLAKLTSHAGVETLSRGRYAPDHVNACQPALLKCHAEAFLASSHQLSQEVFGAASMVVECEDAEQMLAVLAQLEGQLTATLHASGSEDLAIAQALLPALEEMVALHRRGQACPACSSTSGGR
jgi:2,5-dioxopentanoate dehydrogenase